MEPPTPPARARILHLGPVPPVPAGGIAAYLLDLLHSPLAARFDLQALDTSVAEIYRRHRSLRPLLGLRFTAALGLRLARTRPDLVHVHTSDYTGFWEKAFLARLARAAGCPVVLHLHGGSFDRFLAGLPPWQARLAGSALGGAARVLVLSEAWRSLVARFAPAERIEVHPNAIRVAEFASLPRPDPHPVPRLLFLGMLSARKGLDDLLQALLGLGDTQAFEMEIVGGEEVPGERARLESAYLRAGLAGRVHFRGPLYGAARLAALGRADVFVLPSRSESFGIANLEAMAAGVPVVSTRTGAIPEYVEDGVHGLLVEPGDAAGLGRALARMLGDADRRRAMGEAARRRARDFDWEPAAARLGATYERILAETRRGPS